MKYYNNIQRASEGYSAAIAERLWPRASVRRSVCRLLADVIRQAAHTTTAWSVTLNPNSVGVNVGPVQVMTLCPGGVWIVCCKDGLNGTPTWMTRSPRSGGIVYRAVPIASSGYEFEPAHTAAVPRAVRAAALRYVTAAAERRAGKPLWAGAHSRGVIRFLNSYLGESLPLGVSGDPPDDGVILQAYEGAETKAMRTHRRREQRLRAAKLADALGSSSDRRLRCEVPGCGFDFQTVYGALGQGYAQVHHLRPLGESDRPATTRLEDLAIVCANCHVMIHRGGECRPLDELRPGLIADAQPRVNARRRLEERPGSW